MKKNNVMRVFSLLLALTLISVCAISGTFAKYVTKAEGTDQARVAKWGIVLTVDPGEAFATEYEATDENGYEGLAVKATDKVVAPGTNSEEAGGNIVATVNGTPEVATRYTLHIEGLKDVVLPAGEEYVDYTQLTKDDAGKYGYNGTFDLAADYTPVKWNFGVSNSNGTSYDLVGVAATLGKTFPGFSLTDAKGIIETQRYMDLLLPQLESMVGGAQNAKATVNPDGSIDISMDFEPGTEMDYTFTLSWVWDFDDNGAGTNDKADTYLGNIAANVDGIVVPQGASTEIAATITATATQID